MGFVSNVASRIRRALSGEKEDINAVLARGVAGSMSLAGSGRDMFQAYGYDAVSSYLNIENDLLSRYSDYEDMDEDGLLSNVLDLFADDTTQPNPDLKRSIWVTSKNKTIEEVLDRDLLQRTLMYDEEVWSIGRTTYKFGNSPEELLVTNDGVVGLNHLPPATIRRIEGVHGNLYGYVQDFRGKYGYTPRDFEEIMRERLKDRDSGDAVNDDFRQARFSKPIAFEPWEIAFFRLPGKQRRSIYGMSIFDAARFLFRRLNLLEDAILLYRLERAPERFAYYVDVGDLPPQEALAYVNRVRQMHRKKRVFDPSTGSLNMRFDQITPQDDIYIPVRKGQEGARIEVLASPRWSGIEDVEYFLNKIFYAIKAPRAYVGDPKSTTRQSLSSLDVRWSRGIMRGQSAIIQGTKKICRVHMAAVGMDPYAEDYDVHMTIPSAVLNLAQIEVQNARADLGAKLQAFVSEYWILSHVFELDDDEITKIMKEREDDAARMGLNQARTQVAGVQYTQKAFPGIQLGPDGQPLPPPEPQQSPSNGTQRAESSRFDPRLLPGSDLRAQLRSGNWEQRLMNGNREAEKRASDKIDQLLKNDTELADHLKEVGGLLKDLASRSHQIQSRRRF